MRTALAPAFCASLLLLSVGCVVHEPHHRTVVRERVIEEDEPVVVSGPGVEVIEYEPAPVQRVYIYERGYPPGVYFYDNHYYYGGRRYERNVFVTKVVNVNVQRNRYVNVTENRRVVETVKVRHETDYQRTGGKVARPGEQHAVPPAHVQQGHPGQPPQPALHPNTVPPKKKPNDKDRDKDR